MSYFAQLQQNVTVSTLNSSDSNLSGGASFDGTSETTLGVSGIQINLYTTQNCTVILYQSMDGSHWDIQDSFTYFYVKGGASWTTQATASYYKVKVTNLNATVATTSFRLQTALCPIIEALPRALDSENGALKVCVEALDGVFSTEAVISPMGALKTASSCRLAGAAFSSDTLDGNFWATATANGGTAALSGGILTLSTNSSPANGSMTVSSQRVARYVSGNTNTYRAVVNVPATVSTNTKSWGAFDANDGYFFSYDGTNLSVNCRKATVDNPIASGSFNGNIGNTYVLDTGAHTYEIYWTNTKAYFLIDRKLLHTFTGSATTLVGTPHLKISQSCTNTGGNSANNTLLVRVASISRLGNQLTQPLAARISTNTTTTLKLGPGNLHSLVFGKLGTGANTLTIYDNVTNAGTILYVATMTKGSQASDIPFSVDFKGMPFSTGLTIVTATGTACDVTVIYE